MGIFHATFLDYLRKGVGSQNKEVPLGTSAESHGDKLTLKVADFSKNVFQLALGGQTFKKETFGVVQKPETLVEVLH